MNEAEVGKQKYINVLVGSFDALNQTFLVDCQPLERGSNVICSIILQTVDNILRQLEIKRENFLLFLTDAAWYVFGWKDIRGIALCTFYITVLCVCVLILKILIK